jgi:hypothetical protein
MNADADARCWQQGPWESAGIIGRVGSSTSTTMPYGFLRGPHLDIQEARKLVCRIIHIQIRETRNENEPRRRFGSFSPSSVVGPPRRRKASKRQRTYDDDNEYYYDDAVSTPLARCPIHLSGGSPCQKGCSCFSIPSLISYCRSGVVVVVRPSLVASSSALRRPPLPTTICFSP